MEVLKMAVQPLADKDNKNSPFSREKGDFCVVTRGIAKDNSLTLRQFLIQ